MIISAVEVLLFPAQSPQEMIDAKEPLNWLIVEGNSVTAPKTPQIFNSFGVLSGFGDREGIISLLREKAREKGINEQEFVNLAMCESSLIHEGRWGDAGKAYGLFQFWEKTWQENCEGERKSLEDQIECAAELIRQKKHYHWKACWQGISIR